MARPIHYVVLAGLGLVGADVAALLVQVRHLRTNQEQIMARFDGLDADITEMKQAVADAAARVEAAVDRLLDDTADQAQIEEARVEVRDAINALTSIVPVEPTPEPEPTPEEPPVG